MSDAALLDALLAAVLSAVVLLVVVLATGVMRRRRAHLVCVVLFLPVLFTAVLLAWLLLYHMYRQKIFLRI